jgi:hypothetical protein
MTFLNGHLRRENLWVGSTLEWLYNSKYDNPNILDAKRIFIYAILRMGATLANTVGH